MKYGSSKGRSEQSKRWERTKGKQKKRKIGGKPTYREVTSHRAEGDRDGSTHPFHRGGRVTLFGRKPVAEALGDPRLTPQRLFLARSARGELIDTIVRSAQQVGLPIKRMSGVELSRISKNGRQDQGVALDVQATEHRDLSDVLSEDITWTRPVILIDGLHTPANLGMTIRSAWAAGVEGIILPRERCAPLNPLAIKASAGVAIHAAIWGCKTAGEAAQHLTELGIPLYGLAGEAQVSLYDQIWPQVGVWVVGNESEGMSPEVRALLTESVRLPMSGGVESLNAAVAASVVSFELTRQRG